MDESETTHRCTTPLRKDDTHDIHQGGHARGKDDTIAQIRFSAVRYPLPLFSEQLPAACVQRSLYIE